MSIEPALGRIEVPRPPGGLVGDPADAVRVLVGQALGPEEVQEDRARLRVAARAHLDRARRCSCRWCQLRNTSSSSATWKFTWHRPGRSPWNTASLWCTSSIRIRQAASPIQSEARALNVVDQNRWASATSGASRQRWPNSVMPDARPRRAPGGRGCCWPTDQLDPVAERVVEPDRSSPTRRDRASAAPPRHTVNPRLSSSVSASARAPGPSPR